jgi:hypothetical protein
MELGGSMPQSQGLSDNSYPEPNQPKFPALIPISSRSILILSSHLRDVDNNHLKILIHVGTEIVILAEVK